ncbi:MAG TPA: hypothetical protein PKI33_13420 [Anaerolineales bacterium]|nr:hypothetical protein [Anaerolineales bacterium]HNM38063.1 hypothetical protein [Anaerolineales bacterium]
MSKRYKKKRSTTPAWVDSLIVILEILGAIGTVIAGIYSLLTWVF